VILVLILAVGGIGIATKGDFFTSSSDDKPASSTPEETAKPVISSFTATPASIKAGGSTTLQWDVSGATSVSIDHEIGTVSESGTQPVAPESTTTYMLTAKNSAGSVNKMVVVTVAAEDLPVITSFTATPGTITTGMSSSLKWGVTGATEITIDNNVGTVSATGTKDVSPTATTTYTLTASNSSGSVKKTAEVPFTSKPVVKSFTANPETINIGGEATLSWDVVGGTQISIDHDIGEVTSPGTKTVNPTATTTYTLTAMNASGTTTATAAVMVSISGPPVINSFTATHETITTGLSTSLSWNVSGASEISLEQDVGDDVGTVSPSGSQSVTPTANTVYTLKATNSHGTTTRQVSITLTPDPVIVRFTATPDT